MTPREEQEERFASLAAAAVELWGPQWVGSHLTQALVVSFSSCPQSFPFLLLTGSLLNVLIFQLPARL